MSQTTIENQQASSLIDELYTSKLSSLKENCLKRGIEFQGNLVSTENLVICYVNDNVDLTFRKENHHAFLTFSILSEYPLEETSEFKEFKAFIEQHKGIVKNIDDVPQCLYFVEVHILDRYFIDVISKGHSLFQ